MHKNRYISLVFIHIILHYFRWHSCKTVRKHLTIYLRKCCSLMVLARCGVVTNQAHNLSHHCSLSNNHCSYKSVFMSTYDCIDHYFYCYFAISFFLWCFHSFHIVINYLKPLIVFGSFYFWIRVRRACAVCGRKGPCGIVIPNNEEPQCLFVTIWPSPSTSYFRYPV